MPTSTHETVKTTQTTNPDGSSSNVGGIVVGVFVGLVVVGGVALYVVKQGNPLGNQQQSFQNPGNSGNADGVVDGHDNPLQNDFDNNDDENSGGASEPVPTVFATLETEIGENVYDSLDVLGGLSDQAAENVNDTLDALGGLSEPDAPTETTVSIDNDTSATGDLLF